MTGGVPAWPQYSGSADLAAIESVPLGDRDLPSSVYDIVRRAALARPDAAAHHTLADGASWREPHRRTYGDLLQQVHRAANAFTALGVGRRDAVGLLSVNTAELVPALLGAEAAAIAVPINPALHADEVVELLRRAGVRVLVAAGPELSPAIWEVARRVAADLRLDALLALRPTAAAGPPAELAELPGVAVAHLCHLAAQAPGDRLVASEPGQDDVAAFFHTGGTTGTPKLAAHTHRMQVVDAWTVALGCVPDPDAAFFAALPLFHVNALVVTTLAPTMRTQPVVWAGPLGYRDTDLVRGFWQIVERYRVAAMSGVPTVYSALASVPVDADISSLSLAIVGAAPLPPAVAQRWQQHTGIALCEGYGLTEGTCASARSFPGESRAGCVGQRFPYQEVAAVRFDHARGTAELLPAGDIGTIAIRGDVVFPGYVVDGPRGRVLDPAGKVVDGWLDTGDLGSVSADGWVSLVGRAKDVIIRGGHNVDPAPVEQALLTHPDVVDAGVVGRPDPRSGEVPVAYVVLGSTTDLQQVRAWAAARVPEPAAAPVEVTALDALPVTAVGKPDKVALRVLATRDELGPHLEAAGAVLHEGWCTARDGVVHVVLTPADDNVAEACASVLERYAIAWSFHPRDDTAAR
jgi:fatty-acyl-CoA synthase